MAADYNTKTWEVAPCDNGSGFTLRERESGQLMHSRVGPWNEANQIYIAQSELDRRVLGAATHDPLVIYDVGLGIAANSAAAISAFQKLASPLPRPVEILSFEKHPEALWQALRNSDAFPFLVDHHTALEALLKAGIWQSRDGTLTWRLITGDFRELPLNTLPCADLIYFDFYAPAVVPELWGYGIFSKIFPKMHEDGLLITYASTKAVRTALLLAGFFVGEGVATPMKHETTVASPSRRALQEPLTRAWLDRLACSAKPLPSDWPDSRREEGLRRIRAHPLFQ